LGDHRFDIYLKKMKDLMKKEEAQSAANLQNGIPNTK
jgi:hypothetical protein